MLPSSFEQANTNFTPPEGVSEDDCGTIRAFRGQFGDGSKVTITCWKPTQEEIDEIQSGGRVWLYVFGAGMPVVSIGVIDPWS